MQIESLESRTFLSGDPHTVTVPLHSAASGNLIEGHFAGQATHLGSFTAQFQPDCTVLFTGGNGVQYIGAPVLMSTDDPLVMHVEGSYLGGTGRFTGVSGSFTLDVFFSDDQGNFDFRFKDSITFQRPWKPDA
jgi:hypothetical protein